MNDTDASRSKKSGAVQSGWIDDIRRDLHCAARSIIRAPGFAAAVVFTLALATGANTAVFSITHAVLLRPLPYREPGRLVATWSVSSSPKAFCCPSLPPHSAACWQRQPSR
jgi:hypothetical protein